MSVILHLPSAFDRFKREGEIIGRIVIEYGELEWDLCLLVAAVIEDQDTAVKAMYRTRGETARIDIGDALARNKLPNGMNAQIYAETISAMRDCLSIRNKYAHANWTNAPPRTLAFVDIERLARSDDVVDLSNLRLRTVDLAVLEDQQRFFSQVLQNLRYMNMEAQYLLGTSTLTGFHYVTSIAPPRYAELMPPTSQKSAPAFRPGRAPVGKT